MKQPSRNKVKKPISKPSPKKQAVKVVETKTKKQKEIPKYGISKLEQDFAKQFLDAYDIEYIYQYHVKDIGRYYDFAVTTYKNGHFLTENKDGLVCLRQEGQYVPIDFLIEVDGGYYHSDPRLVDESKMNAMQKYNKMVDNIKDKWAQFNGIPLLRVWEYDIRNNPLKVLSEMQKYIDLGIHKRKVKSKRNTLKKETK